MRKMFLKFITGDAVSKKVVISGYYGFKNFGDEAVLTVLTSKLKTLGCNITVLSSDPDWTMQTFNVKSSQTFDIKSVFTAVKNADILISGGGSLLQDVTSIKSLFYYISVILLALILKKQVIIFAQGIGPIKNCIARFIVMKILKRCTYVSVRDAKSLELLKLYGINADLVCDPIYSLDAPKINKDNAIGIQLRDFKTMNFDFINHLAMHVVREFPDKAIRVFSLQDNMDLNWCKCFIKSVKVIAPDTNIELISGRTNQEIITEISKVEYIIAMRFHAIMTALKASVKSLAINYDIKVETLANEAEIPYISLTDFSDFKEKFSALKNENTAHLENFVESAKFNWSKIIMLCRSEQISVK